MKARLRTIIYARLSRKDRKIRYSEELDSHSIENQVKFLTEYAKEWGCEIVKVYYDDGYSGGDFERPGLRAILEATKRKEFDVLLIKDFSRLGRVMHKVGDLIENFFPSHHIRVVAVDDQYDSDSYVGEDSIVFKNFLNDYYLKEHKRKMRIIRKHCALTKHLNYYPKFGYNYDENRIELIDEFAASIVKRAFQMVADGMSCCDVAQIFNNEGVPTRSYYQTRVLGLKELNKEPAKKWRGSYVCEIVKDYEYCGHSLNWVRHKKEERIIIRDSHLAIIDEDLFQRAQEVLSKHNRIVRQLDHIGRMLIDRKTNRHLYYGRNKENEKYSIYFLRLNGFQQYKISAKAIEDAIYYDAVKMIRKCRLDEEKFHEIFKKRIFNGEEHNVRKLRDELNRLNGVYAHLLERYFSGRVSQKIFELDSQKLQKDIQILEEKIDNNLDSEGKLSLYMIKFKKFLDSFKTVPINKKEFIKLAVSKVYINEVKSPNQVDITIVYKVEDF